MSTGQDLSAEMPPVGDDELLWRYIHPTQITRDKQTGVWRPRSGAFIDTEMSVDRASLTTLERARQNRPLHSIAEFAARYVRTLGKNVRPDQLPDNPAHAIVSPQLTKTEARQLAMRSDIWRYLSVAHVS